MSITINLEPRKEKVLRARAARRGRDADGFAVELLDRLLDEPEETGLEETGPADGAEQPEPTLAELFAGRTGLVDSGGRFNYSDHTGKAYTESLLRQQEQKANTQEGQP